MEMFLSLFADTLGTPFSIWSTKQDERNGEIMWWFFATFVTERLFEANEILFRKLQKKEHKQKRWG